MATIAVLTPEELRSMLREAAREGAEQALAAIDRAPAATLSTREVNVLFGFSPTNCSSVHELVRQGLRARDIATALRLSLPDVLEFMRVSE